MVKLTTWCHLVKTNLTVTLATALAFFATSALADAIGVVKRAKGPVTIERSGVQVRAQPGAELQRGDRIITGQDGYATVSMRRTAPLTIGPANDVALDRYAADSMPVVKRPAPPILQSLASFLAVNRQR
jgi:hypothetical protein